MNIINFGLRMREELAGTGKPDTVLTDIKLSVIDANEHVSQNPERTDFWWEVNPHEPT